jgi:hypothetical protein
MNKLKHYLSLSNALSIIFVIALASSAFGQKAGETKDTNATAPANANSANIQTVDSRQSGEWSVGINPTKNTVQLANTTSNPLPVKVIESGARRPFQTRISLNVESGGTLASGFLQIPAGKRFVIENVSAIARTPVGLRMDINYFTYFDDDFDGIADINDITFHRFVLTEQGTFNNQAAATANHKVLVFAEEQIGQGHYQIGVRVTLSGPNTAHAQGQITFSGYLEDLPTVP